MAMAIERLRDKDKKEERERAHYENQIAMRSCETQMESMLEPASLYEFLWRKDVMLIRKAVFEGATPRKFAVNKAHIAKLESS